MTVKKKILKIAKRIVRSLMLSALFPAIYAWNSRAALDTDKVVFVEVRETRLSDSFKVIHDQLYFHYDFDIDVVFLRESRVRFLQYIKNCIGMIRTISTSKYIFLNDASDVVSCLPLREESRVYQLWHACGAFKKWGMSTADLKFGKTRRQQLAHPYYRNLSLVTISSPDVAWAYIEAMNLEGNPSIVKPLGVSRTDVYFQPSFLNMARTLVEEAVPEALGKRIILYAPTFRGRVASAEAPDQLDFVALRDAFKDDYVLLIKNHPFVKEKQAIPDGCEEFAFDVSRSLPINTLLAAADVCISDYSSLMFEFSLLGRPMSFFAYDKDHYDDWRGFYYDYEKLVPGPVITSNEQVIAWLQNAEETFDSKAMQTFREKFMRSCDGHATERIMQEVFGGELDTHRRSLGVSLSQDDELDLSIVIPAHNAMPRLSDCLQSLVRQTYDMTRVEVVFVDDGSSDDTFEEAEKFETVLPNMKLLRLPQASGSPSAPRNLGLAHARGKYVFFLDADDWLGEEAVLRMLCHAEKWHSDILLVKLVGENGRVVPHSMFRENGASVDKFHSKVMWSFAPLKLFRRSLINDLRFPDFMPEDISFVLRAYCRAHVISVAADYPYYFATMDEGEHASESTWDDVESNLRAYQDIFEYVRTHVPEPDRDEVLMRRLFKRDIYMSTVKAAAMGDRRYAESKLEELRELCSPFYRPEVFEALDEPTRRVLDALCIESDGDVLLSIVEAMEYAHDV